MASNGYVRRCCPSCIFYSNEREFGYRCTLYRDLWGDDMQWVPAYLYDSNSIIASLHDSPCAHYVNIKDVKSSLREKFGILNPS